MGIGNTRDVGEETQRLSGDGGLCRERMQRFRPHPWWWPWWQLQPQKRRPKLLLLPLLFPTGWPWSTLTDWVTGEENQ